MLVVDAGVLVDLLIDRPAGTAIREHLLSHRDALAVPAHAEMEVMSALRSLRRSGRLSREAADDAVQDLLRLKMARHALGPLAERMWALTDNVTPYDAGYIALAETLEATLLTGDLRLARAVAQHTHVSILSV